MRARLDDRGALEPGVLRTGVTAVARPDEDPAADRDDDRGGGCGDREAAVRRFMRRVILGCRLHAVVDTRSGGTKISVSGAATPGGSAVDDAQALAVTHDRGALLD